MPLTAVFVPECALDVSEPASHASAVLKNMATSTSGGRAPTSAVAWFSHAVAALVSIESSAYGVAGGSGNSDAAKSSRSCRFAQSTGVNCSAPNLDRRCRFLPQHSRRTHAPQRHRRRARAFRSARRQGTRDRQIRRTSSTSSHVRRCRHQRNRSPGRRAAHRAVAAGFEHVADRDRIDMQSVTAAHGQELARVDVPHADETAGVTADDPVVRLIDGDRHDRMLVSEQLDHFARQRHR